MRRACLVLLLCSGLVSSCKPKYAGTGTLVIEKSPFQPTQCHVLGARATGVELTDDKGTTLEVILPPGRLDAFQEIGGPASVKLTTAGTTRELGSCATLKMKGEGYHEPNRRAASGSASFACPTVTGELTYSGCF